LSRGPWGIGKVTSYDLSLKGYRKVLNRGVLNSIGNITSYGKGNNLIPLITKNATLLEKRIKSGAAKQKNRRNYYTGLGY
jgi:hypothetical protein